MLPTKIVLIGAGSASFGLGTLSALLRSTRLHGSRLALVDRNPTALSLIHRVAERMNREWDAQMEITAHTHHAEALEGARFVVSAIEVSPREELWRQDFEIPLRHGVRQPYAENGGPGGFAHAARNIGPVLEIAHDMEKACPEAWFINFTNPMVRICDAIHRYSKIKVVGLCHQIKVGYGLVGYLLADVLDIQVPDAVISAHADEKYWVPLLKIAHQALQKIDIQAAGLNHFTWALTIRDLRNGEDLYPLVAERWDNADPSFEPLSRRVFKAFRLMPIPGDNHLCEYLPWLSDPITRPWQKYHIQLYDWEKAAHNRDKGYAKIARMVDGSLGLDELLNWDSEGALEVIEATSLAANLYQMALNLPNRGYISNLPEGAIVEVPGIITGSGPQGLGVGALPEGIAALLRRELEVVRLSVDAAVHGDRQAALQCLLLDPCITDLDVAQEILDDYLKTYREHLPAFWQ